MITLIIDTSTDKSLIAIAQGDNLLLTRFLPQGVQSSRYLMAEIDSALKQLKISPASLEAIAVCVGPGSYTGIRVGVAAAKGLAFFKYLPLIGLCALEGFISEKEGKFASLIDARIGGFYVLLQKKIEGTIQHLSLPQLISKEDLANYLEGFPVQVGPHLGYPDPSYLAKIAAKKLEMGEYSSDLELIYLRTPEYKLST